MQPVINIITITKNDLAGVCATLKSTEKLRSFPGVRQIVIDSSSESIGAEVQRFVTSQHNLEYIRQPVDGISQAFNAGIGVVQEGWIWFLNGGDRICPEFEAELLLKLVGNSAADAIIFEIKYMQDGFFYSHPPLWGLWPPLYWVPHPATLLRYDVFVKNGLFSDKYKIAMDGEIWVRFFSRGVRADIVSIPLVLFDQSGISNTRLKDVRHEARRIVFTNIFLLVRIWLRSGYKLLKYLIG